jgi:cytochrome oxidase assembly protein ShyY1
MLKEAWWAVVNLVVALIFPVLLLLGIVWLAKLHKRVAKIEALILQLQKCNQHPNPKNHHG